jgi:hypothetical protein
MNLSRSMILNPSMKKGLKKIRRLLSRSMMSFLILSCSLRKNTPFMKISLRKSMTKSHNFRKNFLKLMMNFLRNKIRLKWKKLLRKFNT